jgi:ERCC4-type nuclease
MTTYTEIGDTIIGDKIIVEARKISDITIIVKSGRHKAQQIILKDNAKCIIDKKAKFLKD